MTILEEANKKIKDNLRGKMIEQVLQLMKRKEKYKKGIIKIEKTIKDIDSGIVLNDTEFRNLLVNMLEEQI